MSRKKIESIPIEEIERYLANFSHLRRLIIAFFYDPGKLVYDAARDISKTRVKN